MEKSENFKSREKGPDMEWVLFLIRHINYPCADKNGKNNIREFYINEAKIALDTIKNPQAKQMLIECINQKF